MYYKIEFSSTAAKQFDKLRDKKLKERFAAALEYIAGDPLIGKPLQAYLKGSYSYRVGDYRVVYVIFSKDRRMVIQMICHRRDVYR